MVKVQANSNGKIYVANNKALLAKELGNKSITANGTYTASSDNLDGYSSVTVNVSGGGGIGITREVSAQGVYQMPASSFTFSLPSNATDVGQVALYYAFYSCTGLTSADLSSLTTVSGQAGLSYAFSYCISLTSVNLSSLTTVSNTNAFARTFDECTGLTSVNLSSLTTVSGSFAFSYAFRKCTSLTSVSFPALTTVSGSYAFNYAFNSCSGLTSVSFPALTTTSFGSSYTNQFSSMMLNTGSTTTHTIHFPSNMETTISGLTGYPLFGGTSGKLVLAFDLPATS